MISNMSLNGYLGAATETQRNSAYKKSFAENNQLVRSNLIGQIVIKIRFGTLGKCIGSEGNYIPQSAVFFGR